MGYIVSTFKNDTVLFHVNYADYNAEGDYTSYDIYIRRFVRNIVLFMKDQLCLCLAGMA